MQLRVKVPFFHVKIHKFSRLQLLVVPLFHNDLKNVVRHLSM